MNDDEISLKLRELLIRELGFSESSLAGKDLLLVGEDSGIDSVGVLRLVMAVEKTFGIVIADSDVIPENFRTLGGLMDLIKRKLV